MLRIYTDGACKNNGKSDASAGYGVTFLEWDKKMAGRVPGLQTNNRAEMYAVYAALKKVYHKHKSPCTLYFFIDIL